MRLARREPTLDVASVVRPRASDNRLTEYANLPKALQAMMQGALSQAGVAVTYDSAMAVAAVYACVRVLAESVAMLPLPLYRRAGTRREQARDDPLWRLMHDQPNEWQTAMQWRELLVADVALRGNHYSMKALDSRGRVIELLRLHPDRVRAQQAPDYSVSYQVDTRDGRSVTLGRDEVLHVSGLGDDGLSGLSVIKYHRHTIGDAIALRDTGSGFWRNGAHFGAVLTQDAQVRIAPEDRKAIRDDFAEQYGGSDKAGQTPFLPPGVDVKQVSLSQEDAQYLETRKFQVAEIARLFRVPPHMIGDLEKATFSNIEQQSLDFVTSCLMPWLVRLEQAFKRDLLAGEPDLYFKFNVDALLRGEAKARAETLQIKRRNGIISANEWRELDDMNPREDEGGDEYIVEQNMRQDDGTEAGDDPGAGGPGPAPQP